MPDTELDDAALIRAYCGGDERAFETLYHRYRRQLYGFLTNLMTAGSGDVDEIFAETWLRVIDKLPTYRDDGRFSAWLFRIARNLYIDGLRRNRPMAFPVELDAEDAPLPPAPPGVNPDRAYDAKELGRVIGDAVGALPPEQREVFLLRQQELAFKEIAELQGCSINTVLGRMQYALKSLRKWIRSVDEGGLLS